MSTRKTAIFGGSRGKGMVDQEAEEVQRWTSKSKGALVLSMFTGATGTAPANFQRVRAQCVTISCVTTDTVDLGEPIAAQS
jgi:hypothetical protein